MKWNALILAPALVLAAGASAAQSQPASNARGPAGQGFRAPTADERAGGANANCAIRIPAGSFRGPCKFTPDGLSFSVEHANGMPMIGTVESFWIEADTRTDARLTGSDPQNGSQDYGIVTRPSAGDACWRNRTASICTYALAPAGAGAADQGGWNFESSRCAADRMVATETGLRIELTSERMAIGVMGPGSAASGTEVELSVWADGNVRDATTEVGQLVDHDGVQWLEFYVPNDEPGGWHDHIANSRSISVAYGRPRQRVTVPLTGSNAVMARLRNCVERRGGQ